jgi:hypothetical protein
VSTEPERTRVAARSTRALDSIFPALIGLAGVLIGAFVTTGVAYLGDRAHRAADKRTAIRLIANEVRLDANSLTQVARQGRLTGGRPPRTDYWQSEAPTLARYISRDQWGYVSTFYTDVLNINPSIPTEKGESATPKTQSYAMTVACEGNKAYVSLQQSPSIKSVAGLNCRD